MRQKRAYRYRFYPTSEQAAVLARTFGCARYVYNWALRLRTDAYYERHERIGYHEASAALTALKQRPETTWLTEVSSVPLQQALRHLDTAFRNFFEGRIQLSRRNTGDKRQHTRVAPSGGTRKRMR
jgi:putative transposase